MLCPKCNTENKMGSIYCAGCGAKLEITEEQAHTEAAEDLRHSKWQKAYLALNRVLFLSLLVFIASLLFRGYATRKVLADFSASAPLPPAPTLALTGSFIKQPRLRVPQTRQPGVLRPEKGSEDEILADLAQTARRRLDCTVSLKTGEAVKGWLLFRTKDELRVITRWAPVPAVRVIKAGNIDFGQSQLPE